MRNLLNIRRLGLISSIFLLSLGFSEGHAETAKAQTLDQALQESIEQRIAATEKFRQKYTEESKELDPFAVMGDKSMLLGDKSKEKSGRQPATRQKNK